MNNSTFLQSSCNLLAGLEIQHALELEPFDFLQRPAGDAVEVAVHADGGPHEPVDGRRQA